MADGFQTAGRIQGSGRHGDAVLSSGVPEQTGPALTAEPAVHMGCFIGCRAVPFQGPVTGQVQLITANRCIGRHGAVGAAAFFAVTIYDPPQGTADFIRNPTA